MKTIKMLSVIMFVSLQLLSQSNLDIPEKNQIVLDAVEEVIGTKVGKGICFNLVDYALKKVDENWDKRSDSKHVYGKKIKSKKILPGDIILYKEVRYKNGHQTYSHIAVVYFILDDGIFKIAEQNTKGNIRKSIVVLNKENINEIVDGKVEFYRPY